VTRSSPRSFGFLAASALGLCCLGAPAAQAQSIPSDAYNYCPVTNFPTWFASGTPTQNGVVVPANSANFDTSTNCNFYRWAEQMFLWITSPAPALYGGNGYVFESNSFYQVVSGPGNSLKFVSVAQSGPGPLKVNLRSAQVDSRGFQIIFDTHNVSHEIQPTPLSKNGTPLLRNSAGKLVPVGKVSVANGRANFSDTAGKPIAPQMKFTAMATPNNGAPVQEFNAGGSDVFVDPDGNVISTSQGQAGGGAVLVGQNGGLVYYTTFVNDVFAYYLTQIKNANGGHTPPGTQFPINAQQATAIVQYAAQHGKAITDPQALTMEFKLSWVEISPSQASNYVSIQALVPVYQPQTSTQWTLTKQTRLVTLGLVGVHVVGSVTNHPEMLWATFERFGNTPNAAYSYLNTASATVNVPQDGNGNWLFCQSTNCASPFNNEMGLVYNNPDNPHDPNNGNIVQPAGPAGPIGPSNTILWHPWGSASNTPPNPFVASAAESNSDVISVNNSVMSQLVGNDIRKNYIFVGNVWTNGGVQPTTPYLSPPGSGNEVGTSQLSNSTMETYQQDATSNVWGVDGSCFQCHNKTTATPATTPTVEISHIWPPLLSLFAPNGGTTSMKKASAKPKTK
jgi:hypothetical protein